ncbi:MAG TPA: oxygenase MpaB family protein [Marmoricola sp.]|nr:oxygenase MpaB family protein [Marmoricola sp.]
MSHEVELKDFIAEQALLLGAGSTVLNQLAMKGVGLGVAEHSTTLRRPVDRLRTTLTYVYVMILGTDAEREAIRKMVNKAHVAVRSEGRYSAYDQDLQLWVAATLAHNGMFIYEKTFGPLTASSRERIYRDSQIFGNALQVDPSIWPATMAEFEVYWKDSYERMEADPAVQAYVAALLDTSSAPLLMRHLLPLQNLMSRGNLDPHVREIVGLSWSIKDQKRYDIFWKVFPAIYRRVPRFLRQLPPRLILAEMRLRMRMGRRVI